MPSESFHIRNALPSDITALAELHVVIFVETHGSWQAPRLAVREQQWRAAFDAPSDSFTVVAESESGALIGFAKGTRHDGSVPGFRGELNKLYVRRAWQRRGAGRLLVLRIARHFLERDIDTMLLFGDARSAANEFYEHLGGERLYAAENGAFHGAYGWRDLRGLLTTLEH